MKKLTLFLIVLLLCSVSLFAVYGEVLENWTEEGGVIKVRFDSVERPGNVEDINFFFYYPGGYWRCFVDWREVYKLVDSISLEFQIGTGSDASVFTYTKKDFSEDGILDLDYEFVKKLLLCSEARLIETLSALGEVASAKLKYEADPNIDLYVKFSDGVTRLKTHTNSKWDF